MAKMTRLGLIQSGAVKIVGPYREPARRVSVAAEDFGHGITRASIYSDSPMFWQRKVTPICQMTEKELNADLAKHVARWKSHDNGKTYDPSGQLAFMEHELIGA